MKGMDCEVVRDLLPDWAAESIPAADRAVVERHLPACPDCRLELELIQTLRRDRPGAPAALEASVQARVRDEFQGVREESEGPAPSRAREVRPIFSGRRWIPVGALSAAAMLVLALGTNLIWGPTDPAVIQEPIVVASQEPIPESWLWDDGMVAGAPVLDGLSDEELEALIEELEG